jgi:glycosyltransferase involved in cell wall biosynthesis
MQRLKFGCNLEKRDSLTDVSRESIAKNRDARAEKNAGQGDLSLLSVCETASGGVGRYQENIAALVRHGILSRVLLPDADRHILGAQPQVSTFHRKRRGVPALISLVRRFLAERRKLKPDVYFFNSTFALLPLLVLRAYGDRTPSVYCAHCWAIGTQNPESWKGKLIRAVEGNLCGLADLVVNVSDADLATARRFGYRGHQIVVENAVGAANPDARDDVFERRSEEETHLLFVGRFDHQKGLDVLLSVFDRARQKNPDLHLHLVGGAVRGGETFVLPDGVINHGWAKPDEIDSFYKSSDALIVPSRWEGMPLVVLESLRNATPVYASTGCGMDDFIARNKCGDSFALDEDILTDLLTGLRRRDLAALRPDAFDAYQQHFTQDRFGAEMSGHLRALVQGRKNG